MKKFLRYATLILLLFVSFSFVLTGCGKKKGSDYDAPKADARVYGNGGLAVTKGDYLYFLNGYRTYADVTKEEKKLSNHENVVRGAIYRTKLSATGDLTVDENGKIVATIFIASFGVLDSDANLNLPVKQLYCLMESAYIALQLQVNPTTIKKNLSLMKICMSVYVQMFMRIFNKEYALSLSPETFEKASYIIGRFFLERIWEYPTRDLIEGYATAGFKYISAMDLDILQSEYDSAKIMDIDDMLKFIKKISPRMSDLNTRYFIERYVNTYHGSSILSIDYLPYVFFILVNTILSSFLISQTALNEIIKNTKGINKFYVELAKSI